MNYTTTVDYECTKREREHYGYRVLGWTKKASKYGYQEGDSGNVHIKFTYEIEYFMYKGEFYDGKGKNVDDEKIKEVFGWDNATLERFKTTLPNLVTGCFWIWIKQLLKVISKIKLRSM